MRLSMKILEINIAIDIGMAPYIRVHTWRIRRLPKPKYSFEFRNLEDFYRSRSALAVAR